MFIPFSEIPLRLSLNRLLMKTDDKILFHRNLLTYQRYIEYNVLKDPLDSPPFLQIFKSFMKIFVISVTKNKKQNNIWSSYSVVVFRLLSVYYHFIFALSISFCNILKFSFYFLSFIVYTDNCRCFNFPDKLQIPV